MGYFEGIFSVRKDGTVFSIHGLGPMARCWRDSAIAHACAKCLSRGSEHNRLYLVQKLYQALDREPFVETFAFITLFFCGITYLELPPHWLYEALILRWVIKLWSLRTILLLEMRADNFRAAVSHCWHYRSLHDKCMPCPLDLWQWVKKKWGVVEALGRNNSTVIELCLASSSTLESLYCE